jgi:hypothetical protein
MIIQVLIRFGSLYKDAMIVTVEKEKEAEGEDS